jgi:L-threonylcarbamoyladenylate synthase
MSPSKRLDPAATATRLLSWTEAAIAEGAALIRAGGCVAVPTETVYGLAADATDAAAVAGIYAAKGRPSLNPLIVHVADRAMAERLGQFDAVASALADAFWPGPLTIVVPRSADCPVASIATAGLDTIALRCPDHPAMQALIAASGRPLAAPSANASGAVSPTRAAHVLASLDGRIPMVVDAGPCAAGLESTIVRALPDRIILLRPGSVTASALVAASGLPVVGDESGAISAPGQLASHYAPGKPVLLDCAVPPVDAFMIGFGAVAGDFQLSATGDLVEAAARLFDALHAGASSEAPRIAVAPIPHDGLGVAINDRLARASA